MVDSSVQCLQKYVILLLLLKPSVRRDVNEIHYLALYFVYDHIVTFKYQDSLIVLISIRLHYV